MSFLKASWKRDLETKIPCTSVVLTPVLHDSHPFVCLSKAFSVRLCWEKCPHHWNVKRHYILVIPQMMNCALIINSFEFWGEGVQVGKSLEILTHEEGELGIFNLGKTWLGKETAGMIARFNNIGLQFSMWKVPRGKVWLNSLTIKMIIFELKYAAKSAWFSAREVI